MITVQYGLMSDMRNHLESIKAKHKHRKEELMETLADIDVKLTDMHQIKTNVESKQELRYQTISGQLAELDQKINISIMKQ